VSRIGKKPIKIPKGVSVKIAHNEVQLKGPGGQMSQSFNDYVRVHQDKEELVVERLKEDKKGHAFQGLYQRLISNMVSGVTTGFSKELEIMGLGYRAQKQGERLILNLGFSHPITFTPPKGISIEVPAPNRIIVKGIDKQQVGQVAANIRGLRPPEPYKGKGVRYAGEYVRRKVGKTGGK